MIKKISDRKSMIVRTPRCSDNIELVHQVIWSPHPHHIPANVPAIDSDYLRHSINGKSFKNHYKKLPSPSLKLPIKLFSLFNTIQPAYRFNVLVIILLSVLLFINGVNAEVCGPPAVPSNAKVKITSNNDVREASYECDSGYELFGPKTIKCDRNNGWDRELPFCGINIAFRKPANQSSNTRNGPSSYANDGNHGNENPDKQECSETQKEPSPWWRVDFLSAQTVRVVRITTRGCCGHQLIQDLEIRVGNSSVDLQRNPLCAWYPGTLDEGTTKIFTCARPLIGQYLAVQLVGVEGSLQLCEVEVFSDDEFSPERCASPNLSADTVLSTFSKMCYEFHVTRGESFDKSRQICQSNGGDLIHDFRGPVYNYILAELDRKKSELRTQLVWIGVQKEPGITARTWKWVNGDVITKPTWGKDQPNNYNGEQNCVVLDGGRNWLWNDVGCNLDYLHFICQHKPLSCGSPESLHNTTVIGKNYTVGATIKYTCPIGHALIGTEDRECSELGTWTNKPPTCKYYDCGPLPALENGEIKLKDNRTTYGVAATYECHKNYTLQGNLMRTCTLNGWSGEQAHCLVDWCPNPPEIVGGSVVTSGRRAGSTATYTCNPGHVLIGDPVLSCSLGGGWTKSPPVCRFVDCGAPARPDRGSLKLLNSSTTVHSIVKYQCDTDYWLVGLNELTCTKEGKWAGDAPVCELITCDTPDVPTGSYVVGYDYNVHSVIEYHCDPGYMLRGDSQLKCMENGEWNSDAPYCEYIDCMPLQPIPHGTMKYLQNTTYIGSEAFYTCIASHKLNGPGKRTCLETGKWSETAPQCIEIRCPEPIIAKHSILSVTGNDRIYGRTSIKTETNHNSVQSYKIGALAKYRCERGFKIIGEPLITCEENGLWSGAVPDCEYVDCKIPPDIPLGKIILTSNATYYGAAVLYECMDGYKLNGVSRRLCSEDGTWTHEQPICEPITCEDLSITIENLLVDMDKRMVGSLARFTCPRGRQLIGNGTRLCQSNGIWSGRNPTCKLIDCGHPGVIENGRVIVINETMTYGGSTEYHCIPNFNRIGPYLRKCMDDGKWSGEEPKCEFIANKAQEITHFGTGIAIGAAVIVMLLLFIGMIVYHRNKARPVKNSENVQAAESKEDQNAAVMSYSSLQNNRHDIDQPRATFNTFYNNNNNNNNSNRSTENIYDQIPSETYYDAPYEMRANDEMYEPAPPSPNTITINGISVR